MWFCQSFSVLHMHSKSVWSPLKNNFQIIISLQIHSSVFPLAPLLFFLVINFPKKQLPICFPSISQEEEVIHFPVPDLLGMQQSVAAFGGYSQTVCLFLVMPYLQRFLASYLHCSWLPGYKGISFIKSNTHCQIFNCFYSYLRHLSIFGPGYIIKWQSHVKWRNGNFNYQGIFFWMGLWCKCQDTMAQYAALSFHLGHKFRPGREQSPPESITVVKVIGNPEVRV